jgi:spermidine/putrescine transport system substrate-binding protein
MTSIGTRGHILGRPGPPGDAIHRRSPNEEDSVNHGATHRSISRRDFLRRAAAAGIVVPSLSAVLAACGDDDGGGGTAAGGDGATDLKLARPDQPVTLPLTGDNPPIQDGLDPEAGPLRILGYTDYIWKKVRNRFADRYGVEIEYSVFDTPEEMVSKVRTGGANYDLIVSVTLENLGKLAYGGLIQPLNKSYIPNFSNVWSGLQSPYYDVDSQYSVPYTVYTTGFTYQNDVVSPDEVEGLENPYDVFYLDKYAGRTHVLNGARDVLGTALLRMGEDINTTDEQVLEGARRMLLDGVDTMNWKFDHVDYNELGDFSIHQTWSGQAVYYQYYLPKDLSIEQFSYVWPPQTSDMPGILTDDVFAITKGASSPVLAHLMIDFLLEPETALENYSYEGYQPPIDQFDPDQVVADGLVPENVRNVLIAEEDLGSGVQQLELPATATQRYDQISQEVTGGV